MRTCVNLHSAEIKFAVGTASFLREDLDFPHKKPFTKPRTRSISIGRMSLGYPSPDIPYRGSEPRWRRPSGGVRISTPHEARPLGPLPQQ